MKCCKNLGYQGRILRLVTALALIVYAIYARSWIAGFLGAFVLLEAILGWCVVYQILGISCKAKDKKKR